MTSDRHLVSRVVIVAALLLTMAVAFVSQSALRSFEAELRPELEREASVVGEIGARTLQRAIELGVPFGSLSGVDEYLVGLLTVQQGLSYVLLADAVGQTIASAGGGVGSFSGLPAGTLAPQRGGALMRQLGDSYDAALPILEDGRIVGWIHVGITAAGAVGDWRLDHACTRQYRLRGWAGRAAAECAGAPHE